RYGDPRQPALLDRGIPPARAARRRQTRASAREIPDHVEPCDDRGGARRRRPDADRGLRRTRDGRHLHSRVADAAARDRDADDQRAEVGLLRAEPAETTRDVRQPGRLRALGDRGPRRARRVGLGGRVIAGRAIVAGSAEGEALVTREPLSFWGGYDFAT